MLSLVPFDSFLKIGSVESIVLDLVLFDRALNSRSELGKGATFPFPAFPFRPQFIK